MGEVGEASGEGKGQQLGWPPSRTVRGPPTHLCGQPPVVVVPRPASVRRCPCRPGPRSLHSPAHGPRAPSASQQGLRHWVMLTAREKPGPQKGLDSGLLCPPEETVQAAASWTGTLQRPAPRSRLPLTQGLTQPGDPRRRKSKPCPLLAAARPPRGPCTLTQAPTGSCKGSDG